MKKILISFLLFLGIFIFGNSETFAACNFDPDSKSPNGDNSVQTISNALNDCFENDDDTKLVKTRSDNSFETLDISDGFKNKIDSWVKTLGSILAILAVGSIVYGSLLLVLSRGEEEKLKKGKDVIKWGIVGFLGVVFAGALITVVINIMFSI